jgi:hypothetical protein
MLWVCGSTGVGSCESKCRGVGGVESEGGVGECFPPLFSIPLPTLKKTVISVLCAVLCRLYYPVFNCMRPQL